MTPRPTDTEHDKEAFAALTERCEAWKALALKFEALCVCYRLGRHASDKLLDEIRSLKDRLGIS